MFSEHTTPRLKIRCAEISETYILSDKQILSSASGAMLYVLPGIIKNISLISTTDTYCTFNKIYNAMCQAIQLVCINDNIISTIHSIKHPFKTYLVESNHKNVLHVLCDNILICMIHPHV